MKKMLSILFLISSIYWCYSQKWELKKDKEKIQIYTKKVDSIKIVAFKAVTTIKAPLDKIKQTILNGNGLYLWQYKTIASKSILTLPKNKSIVWMHHHLGWPLKDRETFSLLQVIEKSKTEIEIHLCPAPGFTKPNNNNAILITNFKGKWHLKQEKNHVIVSQELLGDPKVNIPYWLINSTITKAPYNSFSKLKALLEKEPLYLQKKQN